MHTIKKLFISIKLTDLIHATQYTARVFHQLFFFLYRGGGFKLSCAQHIISARFFFFYIKEK